MTALATYRLAPGAQVLRRSEDRLLIRTEATSVELKGPSARLFEDDILPGLDGSTSVADLAKRAGLRDSASLEELLGEMNRAGVLVSVEPRPGAPVLDYLEMIGADRQETADRLADLKVAVVGGDGPGRQIAEILATMPLGLLTLASNDDVALLDGVAETQTETSSLDEDAVARLAAEHDYVVSCFGAAFAAVDHRLNRAVHDAGKPAIFCRVGAAKCIVGPMVFPFETACFTCHQMRAAACAPNFADHMDYEDARAARSARDPAQSPLPHLSALVAGSVVNELLKAALALGQPMITDAVMEFEPFKGGWTRHPVLRRSDCPVCSKKNSRRPITDSEQRGLAASIDRLVSPSTGLIRKLERVHKDLSEPALPYVYRAELANHRFLEDEKDAFVVASGKGFTQAAAQLSAVGEAVERYSAAGWSEDRVTRGAASELDVEAIDPTRLVLFAEDQYETLKYDPYSPEASLGWVEMTSRADGRTVAVPALAVLMAYETSAGEPFLFPITSNGLAAGPTLDDAILSAACECIERDAFLLTWLNRLPAQRIRADHHPDADMRGLVESYARRGVALELYHLATDAGIHVFMGLAVSAPDVEGPAVVVGLGAGHDLGRAAAGALIEVCQVRPALRMKMRTPETQERLARLLAEPQSVTELEDHDLLYAAPDHLDQFDFLRQSHPISLDWGESEGASASERLSDLSSHLRSLGTELLSADLTLNEVRDAGAHVARVVIPDFQPMHFGFAERRLAARRLYDLPVALGLRESPATRRDLNPFPHPLA